jgi:DNA-binding XRE family transcriptional regulator
MSLRQTRHQLGWTQQRMANELGISLRTYCRQEKSGGSAPLLKLSHFICTNQQKKNQCQNPPPPKKPCRWIPPPRKHHTH